MAGLFDNIFGAPGGMYADMLSPEQQAAIRKQSMLQMAAKLLEGSGPSPVRRTLGQNLGSALGAGAEAVQSGQTNAVQQMLLKQKLDEAKLERDRAAQISKIFGAGQSAPAPLTGIDAINAPASGAVGPTTGRAAAIGTMPASQGNASQAARYREAANVFASDPAKAKAYMDIANQLDPRPEVTGQPFEATDMAGNPIMVQQMKDGTTRTMEGFGPKRDVVLQSLGGRMVAIDKNKLKGNESFAMTMTPGELASNKVARGQLGVAQSRLGLDQERFKSEGYTVQDSAEGKVYVSRDPTKPTIPVLGPSGSQLKSRVDPPADFMKSAKKLQDMEGTLKDFKGELDKNLTVFPPEIPLPFGAKIPLPTGTDTATIKAKYNALLMGVKDLYELGALTGPDMAIVEQQLTNPASFSGLFTSRAAMGQQVQVLEDMLARSKENLSTTYNRPIPGKNITVDY